MPKNRDDVIRIRLGNQYKFDAQRKKVHNLRKLIAGDVSPLGGVEQRVDDDSGDMAFLAAQINGLGDLYEILVSDFDEGRSNKMLQSTRTILMQTAYTSPEVDFNDLDDYDAALHSAYLKARLGPRSRGCAAMDQMRLALLDYLIGAVGWSLIAIEDGKPVIRCVDSLDVTYDTGAKLLPDIRWASVKIREPIWKWIDLYGRKALNGILTELSQAETPSIEDALLQVEHYYDVEGEQGNYYVWARLGDKLVEKPLDSGKNPFYCKIDGSETPFLPCDPVYHLAMPSVKFPTSFVEMMLPNQIAVWESERYMREVVQRGKPFYEIEEGSLDDEDMAALREGENGSIVERRKNSQPIVHQPGLEIPQSVDKYHQYNSQEITSNGGADPSASGHVIEADFATQVAAVQQQSGLTAGMVAKDHTAHWERTIKKFLMAAVLYDDMPINVSIDGTRVQFDATNPISHYLAPDAEAVVREDATLFQPKQQAIAQAMQNLQVAMSLGDVFPNAKKEAYTAFLKAMGVRNASKWLEVPQMAPQAPGMPMQGQQPMSPDGLAPQAQVQGQIG